jgi:SAM-dependent methyltransferase
MSDIYRRYTTITGLAGIDHPREVSLTASHFRSVLLPVLIGAGARLGTATIVEFGAGWGRNLLAIRELGGGNLRGSDASAEQVALARRLGLSQVSLVDERAAPLAGEDASSVDILLAIDVLEHLPLPTLDAFARAAERVLRPGGFLVVQVPNSLAPMNPVPAGDITHLRAFNAGSVVQVLRMCGVEPVVLRGVQFPGGGAGNWLRLALAGWVVAPVLRAFARVLYGAREEPWIVEPNLLAVGRKPVP